MNISYITLAVTHKQSDVKKLAEMAANHVYSMDKVAHCEVIEVPAAADMTAEAWAELHRLREMVKGPAGFATWQDLAIHLGRELKEALDSAKNPPAGRVFGPARSL